MLTCSNVGKIKTFIECIVVPQDPLQHIQLCCKRLLWNQASGHVSVWITVHSFRDNTSCCSRNPIKTVCLLFIHTLTAQTTGKHTDNEPPKDLNLQDVREKGRSIERIQNVQTFMDKMRRKLVKIMENNGEKLGQRRV